MDEPILHSDHEAIIYIAQMHTPLSKRPYQPEVCVSSFGYYYKRMATKSRISNVYCI